MRTLQHKFIAFLYRRYILNFIQNAERANLDNPRAWMKLAQQKINEIKIPLPYALVERIDHPDFKGIKVKTRQTRSDDKAILYFHGGGFVAGSPDLFVSLAYQLSKSSGMPVYLLKYPLLPQASSKTILAAAKKSYNYLMQDLQIPARNIAFGGDSAGGGLALTLLNALKTQDEALPACWFGLSPWVDLTLSTASFNASSEKDYILLFPKKWYQQIVADYALDLEPSESVISPLFADFKGLPPAYIQSGGDERLLDENIELARRLKKSGVVVQHDIFANMPHAFQIMPLAESKRALQQIGAFVSATIIS